MRLFCSFPLLNCFLSLCVCVCCQQFYSSQYLSHPAKRRKNESSVEWKSLRTSQAVNMEKEEGTLCNASCPSWVFSPRRLLPFEWQHFDQQIVFKETFLNNCSYLCCSMDAAHCMTCGMEATMNLHLGISSSASVKLGERPKWMFCTRTFSKICTDTKGGY